MDYLKRDLSLFFRDPKAYLYSFTFPSNSFISITPFDPKSQKYGRELVQKVKKVLPDLNIQFVGAASLGLPQGDGDIDLIASAKPQDFTRYLPKLNSVFGTPVKVRPDFVEWHCQYRGFAVELALADPESPIFTDPLDAYNLLNDHPDLLRAYSQLKLESNGVSQREYKRRKLDFFTKYQTQLS